MCRGQSRRRPTAWEILAAFLIWKSTRNNADATSAAQRADRRADPLHLGIRVLRGCRCRQAGLEIPQGRVLGRTGAGQVLNPRPARVRGGEFRHAFDGPEFHRGAERAARQPSEPGAFELVAIRAVVDRLRPAVRPAGPQGLDSGKIAGFPIGDVRPGFGRSQASNCPGVRIQGLEVRPARKMARASTAVPSHLPAESV